MVNLVQFSDLKAEGMKIPPDYFEHSENREMFLKWKQSDELTPLKDSLDNTLHEYLDSLLAKVFLPIIKESETSRQQTLSDCVARLQEKWLRSSEARKEELLAIEAETGGVAAQLAKLEEQGIEEGKQLKGVIIRQGHGRQPIARRSEQ